MKLEMEIGRFERSTDMTKLRRLMLSLGAVAAFLMAAGAGFRNY
jgi:hypothetical protein